MSMNIEPTAPTHPESCPVPTAAPVFGPTNPDDATRSSDPVKRYAAVVELNPENEQLYRKLHANVWPEVQQAIKNAKIRNFNIFTAELNGKKFLFSFMEYTGSDPAGDFASIGHDPVTRDKWWPLTNSCQIRLPGTPDGEQWTPIEMLMHLP